MRTITLTCPNCDGGVAMESDSFGRRAQKGATYTCPECGWTEAR